MMKNILNKTIIFSILLSCKSYSQPDPAALKVFSESFDNVSFHQVIFLEPELIELCKDSIGRSHFSKSIHRFKRTAAHRNAPQVKIDRICFLILSDRVRAIQSRSEGSEESVSAAEFILNQIDDLKADFVIDEAIYEYLLDDKNRDLATKEACDIGISKFVLFVYDPQMYAKVYRSNKSISSDGSISFPYNCSIKDFDQPEAVRKNMQAGLVNMLNKYDDPDLKKIQQSINAANITESFD